MKKCMMLLGAVLFVSSCYATQSLESSVKKESEKSSKEKESVAVDTTPEFKISGSASVHTGFTSPSVKYYEGEGNSKHNKKNSKDTSMARISAGDAEVIFAANGNLSDVWTYGAKISLDANKGDTGVDKMYVTLARQGFMIFNMGNVKGPDGLFLCGGQQLIGAVSGLDGALPSDMCFATGLPSPINLQPYTNKATKFSLYTQPVGGLQFGFAITPDTKHFGHEAKDFSSGSSRVGNDAHTYYKSDKDKECPSGRNHMAFGLKHEYKFNENFGTNFAVVYVAEDTRPVTITTFENKDVVEQEKIQLRNGSAYQITGSMTYKQFTLGCGYLNNGKSRLPKKAVYENRAETFIPGGFLTTKDSNAGSAWNIGARYIFDKWTFATVFHHMERKFTSKEKIKGNAISFSVDYNIVSGCKLFAEIDYVRSKSPDCVCEMYNVVHDDKDAVKRQKTGLLILGAKVSF